MEKKGRERRGLERYRAGAEVRRDEGPGLYNRY